MTSFSIGTRGSPLALWQAHEVQRLLCNSLHLEPSQIPLAIIKTSGDTIQDRALSEAGGKGLFTKEIDEAQFDGRARIAVHSAKDLPTRLPEGLIVAGYLPRAAVQDALISRHGGGIAQLPHGARIGSASLRRQALLKRLRPDLQTELLRGNVETRLRAISEGRFDATLLAFAGLKRLGLEHHVTAVLDEQDFPPAPGQGAIAITIRADDLEAAKAVTAIACIATGYALAAERAFLETALEVLAVPLRHLIPGVARFVVVEVAGAEVLHHVFRRRTREGSRHARSLVLFVDCGVAGGALFRVGVSASR